MDFVNQRIDIILLLLVIGILLIILFLVSFLYGFKLIIPKSKLYDDEFINTVVFRVKWMRRISFIILHIILLIFCIGIILQYFEIFSFFTLIPQSIKLILIALFFISMPFGMTPIRFSHNKFKSYWNADDVWFKVRKKRNNF